MIQVELKPAARRYFKVLPRIRKASLSWRIKNSLKWEYIKPILGIKIFGPMANFFGLLTIHSQLSVRVLHSNGTVTDYGVVSRRVVTTAGVNYIVDDWDAGASDINLLDFHGYGTGTTAAVVGDTALETELTTEYASDNTRPSGTNTQPSANIFQSVGTLAPDSNVSITEHGILSQAAVGGGTLWDRHVFSAIALTASQDSLETTYQLTFTAGG